MPTFLDLVRRAAAGPPETVDLDVPAFAPDVDGLIEPRIPARPGHALRTNDALYAALLDASGATPDALRKGISVIRSGVNQAGRVKNALGRAYPEASTSYDAHRAGSLVLLECGSTSRDPRFDDALDAGADIIYVTSDSEEYNVAALVADRAYRLPDLDESPLVLSRVIEAVCGNKADVHAIDVHSLSFRDVLLGVRPGLSPYGALANVRRIKRKRIGAPEATEEATVLPSVEAKKAAQAAAAKPEPAPPAPIARDDVTPKLSELTGFGAAREWGIQLGRDLKSYSRGELEWIDIDRGILLTGDPGVGKTFFARALAAECECELVVTGYQDWSAGSNWGGDQISKNLHKLFTELRKKPKPVIVFIDELDSIGKRGASDKADYWYGPIINSWLQFLDGGIPRDGIVVIGATNLPDRIDPALKRSGRLEREVRIPLPTIAEMRGIVRYHCGLDSDEAARVVRGRTPAQVAQDCRDARRAARADGRRPVTVEDLRAAVVAGRPQRTPAMEWRTAIHEAGHAIRIADGSRRGVLSVDLDAGETRAATDELCGEADLLAEIGVSLAGRAAEQVILGDCCVGSIEDLSKATALATAIHTDFGYGVAGLRSVSEDMVRFDARIQHAVEVALASVYEQTLGFIAHRRFRVESLARALLEKRYLDASEIADALDVSALFSVAREDDIGPEADHEAFLWRHVPPGEREWVN